MKQLNSVDSASSRVTRPSSILVRLGDETWHTSGPSMKVSQRDVDEHDDTDEKRDILRIPRGQTNSPIRLQSMRREVEAAKTVRIDKIEARRRAKRNPVIHAIRRYLIRAFAYVSRTILPKGMKQPMTTLKGGLLVGMVLGCFALIGFHALISPVSAQESNLTTTSQANSSMPATVSTPASNIGISMPGFQVSMVQVGPFTSPAQQQSVRNMLTKDGAAQVVAPNGYIDANVALTSTDAMRLRQALANVKTLVSVRPVHFQANRVMTLATADPATVNGVSTWLSNANSALLSVTAWLSDSGRVSDATTALMVALRSYPGDAALARTGISNQLLPIERVLTTCQQAMNRHQKVQMQQEVVAGFNDFMSIHGIDASP